MLLRTEGGRRGPIRAKALHRRLHVGTGILPPHPRQPAVFSASPPPWSSLQAITIHCLFSSGNLSERGLPRGTCQASFRSCFLSNPTRHGHGCARALTCAAPSPARHTPSSEAAPLTWRGCSCLCHKAGRRWSDRPGPLARLSGRRSLSWAGVWSPHSETRTQRS